MLSQENRDKLILSGLYKTEPNKKLKSWYDSSSPFHCFNWTFKVQYNERLDKYSMVDTYFNDKYIEITDDNIELFELIFNFNDVKSHNGTHIWDYDEEDRWNVAIDSGGIYCGGKYFIKKGAVKNKEKVLNRLSDDVRYAKDKLERLQKDYEDVLNDNINLDYV